MEDKCSFMKAKIYPFPNVPKLQFKHNIAKNYADQVS